VTLARSYEPYGQMVSSVGNGISKYGFTGEWTDDYIMFLYLRSRWYSPYLNQFIQPDPIVPDNSNPQNLHAYSYVRNNPINLLDPSGKCVGENCVDNDHRNLTYWLINAMKVNSQSSEVDHLRQLNRLGNLSVGATLADLIIHQITGEINITDCDLISAIWDSSTGMPKDVFKREAYIQWMDLVKKGARWDFKKRIFAELNDSIRLCGMNGCSSWFYYDVIANIHFGYVGRAAGFTSFELHIGAGIAQAKDSPGTGKWYTFGDEPADYWAIEMGISLYQYARPAGLNALWFKNTLYSSQGHLKSSKRPKMPYYNYTYGVDEELGPMFPVDYFNGNGED